MENLGQNGVHPLLRGGRPPYPHRFSKAQMESLAAICDTLVPSVTLEERFSRIPKEANYKDHSRSDKDVDAFYSLSGSQNGVPEHVAGMIMKHVIPMGVYAAWVVLWLLSTRLGTFLLCGRSSLVSNDFPYVQKFPLIPRMNREKILLQWSQGSGSVLDLPFRMFFKLFKALCVFTFYSMVDVNCSNPSWRAIGYAPPEPALCQHDCERPLEKGVIDVSLAGEKLPLLLGNAGFTVTEDYNSNFLANHRGSGACHGGKLWRVECDAVVVGSGSGGGVAAAVLAQAGYRVIVLEKGKYYARQQLSLLEGPSVDQMYELGGALFTEDSEIILMAGATVGGGSAVNWAASIRTPPKILKEWSTQHGLSLFQREEYQNAMDQVCARLGVQEGCEKESFQNSVLRRGCSKLGYDVEYVPRNSPPDHFCGSCHFGCRNGAKQGANETWLVDATVANALILSGCTAEAVLNGGNGHKFKKRRAVGVLARIGDGPHRIFVEAKATVVACGSLLTPPLLLASGLRNRNIGRKLRLHLSRLAWGYFPEGELPEGNCYEGGIITSMNRWERSGRGMAIQTPGLYPGNFSVSMPWISGIDMKERMLRFNRTAHLFAMTRDSGIGVVGRKGNVSYRFSDSDNENLAYGLERALRILIAAGAVEVGTHQSDGERFRVVDATPGEIEGFLARVKKRELKKKVWNITSTAHQMGSCRMGIDPETSAVDEKGESWEVEGLYVCDASVFPTGLGVNPMITVQSVALCISRNVVEFLQTLSPT
eukprot:Gb_20886 [translate_table: standard]